MTTGPIDTIAAIATPPGRGGIGIVRISGPLSRDILRRLFTPSEPGFSDFCPWKLHHGTVHDGRGRALDDVLAVFMPGPRTFTGEDVAEIHCHGGQALLGLVLNEVLRDARLAERGEFSKRAFMNGRMDLTQAEAVAELIDAPSAEGARLAVANVRGLLGRRMAGLKEALEHLRARVCLAVDFPDDEVPPLPKDEFLDGIEAMDLVLRQLLESVKRTRVFREGCSVALAGLVNAGKSSLMNAFLGHERAIVTPAPGTTRDFLEEPVVLDGLSVRLIDTAGLRIDTPQDPIEAEGIRLGRGKVGTSDVVLFLVDGTEGITPEVHALASGLPTDRLVLVWNKADLAPSPDFRDVPCAATAVVSAKNGTGVDELATVIRKVALAASGALELPPDEVSPNARQAASLGRALESLRILRGEVHDDLPYELCAVRLDETARELDAVVGIDTADDILNRIFDRFCIGK